MDALPLGSHPGFKLLFKLYAFFCLDAGGIVLFWRCYGRKKLYPGKHQTEILWRRSKSDSSALNQFPQLWISVCHQKVLKESVDTSLWNIHQTFCSKLFCYGIIIVVECKCVHISVYKAVGQNNKLVWCSECFIALHCCYTLLWALSPSHSVFNYKVELPFPQ